MHLLCLNTEIVIGDREWVLREEEFGNRRRIDK